MKLIPSVYLLINPNNSNTTFHSEQLAIFIRLEYFVNTSSLMHMPDLLIFVNNQDFAPVLLKENKALDLDYLTICTHAPYQSAYNSVKRSMAFLSEKLTGITLPIDEYGVHLDSQKNVVNKELAQYNFEFSENRLCELWNRDNIYDKPVTVYYVDQISQPFGDINHQYCHEYKTSNAALLLVQNNGFLLPIAKE
ncbi:15189_t:CDS:2 [Cetraspora pellucida]|uniref:15189_t:CDS:1 n=1 Tax=Cetraspora pellucida TaxID=1433469 RepID=A0A9N9BKZ1_9GLOM|nr:15189_t:CDS:2 [Cetraspora pellucida]